MSNISQLLEAEIKISEIAAYTENGCNIRPKINHQLYRLDYWEATKLIPGHDRFASMSFYDGLDAAKSIAKKRFGDFQIKLSIPVLVIEVPIKTSLK